MDARAREDADSDIASVATGIIIDNQRQRLRRLIAEEGPFDNVQAICDRIAALDIRADGDFKVVSFDAVVGTLWSLQKQGEVTFNQRSAGSGSKGHGGGPSGSLTKIKATKTLISRLGLPERVKDWPPRVLRTRRTTPVGRDGTNAKTQPSIAPGGPVERRMAVDRAIPEAGLVTPTDDTVHPVGVDPTDHHNQPDETFEVPEFDLDPGEPVPEPWTQAEPAPYPILAAIRAKAGKAMKARQAVKLIEEAAELLPDEERGRLIDEAVNLISHHDLTEIEEEYLTFAESAYDAFGSKKVGD